MNRLERTHQWCAIRPKGEGNVDLWLCPIVKNILKFKRGFIDDHVASLAFVWNSTKSKHGSVDVSGDISKKWPVNHQKLEFCRSSSQFICYEFKSLFNTLLKPCQKNYIQPNVETWTRISANIWSQWEAVSVALAPRSRLVYVLADLITSLPVGN